MDGPGAARAAVQDRVSSRTQVQQRADPPFLARFGCTGLVNLDWLAKKKVVGFLRFHF